MFCKNLLSKLFMSKERTLDVPTTEQRLSEVDRVMKLQGYAFVHPSLQLEMVNLQDGGGEEAVNPGSSPSEELLGSMNARPRDDITVRDVFISNCDPQKEGQGLEKMLRVNKEKKRSRAWRVGGREMNTRNSVSEER
jgi:hypothetical protein